MRSRITRVGLVGILQCRYRAGIIRGRSRLDGRRFLTAGKGWNWKFVHLAFMVTFTHECSTPEESRAANQGGGLLLGASSLPKREKSSPA